MDIQAALLPVPLPVKATQLNLSQWLLGQILNAAVTGRKSADTLILQIQNQQIEAKTNPDKAINVGEQLKLVVEKTSNPVVLRVLQQDSAKVIHEIKQQLLRESMPKQESMKKLTTILNQVSNNVREVIKLLPAPIEQQFKKLIEHLPTKTNLNNETGLKTAIKNSGVFLELKLLTEISNKKSSAESLKTTGKTAKHDSSQILSQTRYQGMTKDLKANLLQLSDVISKYKQQTKNLDSNFIKQAQIAPFFEAVKKSTSRMENNAKEIELALKLNTENLNRQIESSIARIEVNQSKAIVTHDNQTPIWSIEIPVKNKQDIDLVKLNIQANRDSKSKNTKEQLWTANLKIDFANIGAVSAKLSIIDKEVNATLWSENETLNELINDNLFLLNKQIERCGLSTGKIICLKEMPVEQKIQSSDNNLISITI
jgi:flagellar hook-length control protein FliK